MLLLLQVGLGRLPSYAGSPCEGGKVARPAPASPAGFVVFVASERSVAGSSSSPFELGWVGALRAGEGSSEADLSAFDGAVSLLTVAVGVEVFPANACGGEVFGLFVDFLGGYAGLGFLFF